MKLLLAQAAIGSALFIALSAVVRAASPRGGRSASAPRSPTRACSSPASASSSISGCSSATARARWPPLFLTQPIFGVFVAALFAGDPLTLAAAAGLRRRRARDRPQPPVTVAASAGEAKRYNRRMPTQPSKTLEVVPNPHPDRDYEITMAVPEFTCLCPMTGQPDFATIRIRYVPDQHLVELKSLKLYLWSYRQEGAFHEDVTNRILDDLVGAARPALGRGHRRLQRPRRHQDRDPRNLRQAPHPRRLRHGAEALPWNWSPGSSTARSPTPRGASRAAAASSAAGSARTTRSTAWRRSACWPAARAGSCAPSPGSAR